MSFALTACGSDDVSGVNSCETDRDCELGTVCTAAGVCDAVPCEFCADDHVCLVTEANPEGTCSAPECVLNEDCDGVPCVAGVCGGSTADCVSAADCDDGQICNFANRCVDDPNNGGGGEGCTSNGDCTGNETCDVASGQCVGGSSCGLEASDCTGATPVLDSDSCACVECIQSSDCGGGQVCQGGSCQAQAEGCQTECSSSTPGACQGTGTPYCVNECCVECLGAADCGAGQMCLDGFCGTPPDCSTDPSVCPTGYDCSPQGECVPPQTGQDCAADPMSCPDGTFCDPDTGVCQGFGGDFGCGFCNPDCTCDNGLTCNGMACETCVPFAGHCADGLICDAIFTGWCIPNFF